MTLNNTEQLASLRFDVEGLLPIVVQHFTTGEVLMLGYADVEALKRTLGQRQLWLYSRSRQEYWHKGGTSGNTQEVVSMHADCDADAVLIRVIPQGPICHTGSRSCFGAPPTLTRLADVIADRADAAPESSYTARLLRDSNLRLKKLGEEAVELALACAAGHGEEMTGEAADLIYHVLVACAAGGVNLDDILRRLDERSN